MAITILDQPHRILKQTSSSFHDPVYGMVRLIDGKIAAGWEETPGNTTMQRFELSVISANNTSHTTPAIVFSETPNSTGKIDFHLTSGRDGRFMASWGVDQFSVSQSLLSGDTFGRLFAGTGAAAAPASAHSTSTSGGEFRGTFLSLSNGNYLATWTDSQATTLANYDTNVMGRIFTAAGAPSGGEFVLTTGAGTQISHTSAALPDGRGVVVFENGTTSHANPSSPAYTASGLAGYFITSAGAVSGASFAIDAITAGWRYQGPAQVVSLGNGGFVVAWQQTNAAGTTDEIHFQRFSSTGAKVGGEVVAASISYLGSFSETAENFKLVELANGGFGLFYNHVFGGGTSVSPHLKLYSMTGAPIGGDTVLTDLAPSSATAYLNYADNVVLGSSGELFVLGNYRYLPVGLDNGGFYLSTQRFDLGDERLIGTAGADTLWGREGVNDIILGLDGNDTLNGLSGNDTLDPGASGIDVLKGGAGNDTYLLGARTSGVSIIDTGGVDHVTSSVTRSLTSFATVENLTLIGAAHINATGNALVNIITGTSGNNVIDGGLGTDTLRGGLGNDTYMLSSGVDIVQDTGGVDAITTTISRSLTNYPGIESITLLGTANTTAIGNALDNKLIGNSGNNTLDGGNGNDTLDPGSAGTDLLRGGNGNDFYYLGLRSNEAITITDASGSDTVQTTISRDLTSFLGVEHLMLLGTGNINGMGDAQANSIFGNSGANSIEGRDGADNLRGGAGNDRYLYRNGQTHGAETISDTAGFDTISLETAGSYDFRGFAAITGIDALDFMETQTAIFNLTGATAFPNLTVDGAVGVQTLYFRPNVVSDTAPTTTTLTGLLFANWTDGDDIVKIDGTFGVNTINGSSRTDIIWGDDGADIMDGGLGNDFFVYGTPYHSTIINPDTISGFVSSSDKIDLRPYTSFVGGSWGLTGNNGQDAFVFSGNEVRWEAIGSNVEIQVSEDGTEVMKIILTGRSTLNAPVDILL